MTDPSKRLPDATPDVIDTEAARVLDLQIEPTTRCNYTCEFCCGRKMDQKDLDLETFRQVLDQFPELERLELHGEGEPLLHPELFDMVDMARSRGVRISVTTNGSLLSPPRIDRILSSGIESVLVSVESADPDEFAAIRGGKLSKVVAGVRALIEARDRRGQASPTVGLAITVLRRTRDALPGIAQLYTDLGMDGGLPVHMLSAMPFYLNAYDADMKGQVLTKTEQALTWSRYMRLTKSGEYSVPIKQFWDKVFGENLDRAASGAKSRPTAKTYRSCPWLDEGLYVDRHGQASGCPRIKDTGRHALGKIGQRSRYEILMARDAIAAEVRAGALPESCSGCFIAESIAQRLTGLLDRRPARQLKDAKCQAHRSVDSDPVVGSVPMPASTVSQLLALCDGNRTAREVLAALLRHQDEDAAGVRKRALPILNELVRAGELTL